MIRFHTKVFIAACAVAMLAAAPSTARASAFDKLMILTFNQPVSLPHVTLPAGTYRFELADPADDRTVVRVTSEDGKECYGTFFTIPESETERPDSPVTVEKRGNNLPRAITDWFYPGDTTGRAFVYPQEERFSG